MCTYVGGMNTAIATSTTMWLVRLLQMVGIDYSSIERQLFGAQGLDSALGRPYVLGAGGNQPMSKPSESSVSPEIVHFLALDCEGQWRMLSCSDEEVHSFSSRTEDEEGYQVETRVYEYSRATGKVTYTSSVYGRDCDGRLDCWSVKACHYSRLAEVEPHPAADLPSWARIPAWQETSYGQCDHEAERAGY
jgi:hypothetical protein